MPFLEVTKMEMRRKLVESVLSGRSSLSAACRSYGVSRVTGRKWLNRAKEVGVAGLAEQSRRRKTPPKQTDQEVVEALLELRKLHPTWGARKLCPVMFKESGIELPTRTAEEILRRENLTKPSPRSLSLNTFERSSCGMLLQMDFKGLPVSTPYSLLTVLDDHSRYCFTFEAVRDKQGETVRSVLWELFGEHGLPDSMLMDNGDCWGSTQARMPTRFEAWLLRLGIRPIHGRPRHPQTQGKVERFHRTAALELGSLLVQPDIATVQPILRDWLTCYNWVRPHDALGGKVPGNLYQPFGRRRPAEEPAHEIPEGALSRRVDSIGWFSFGGTLYKAGRGLIGESVVLRETELGMCVSYAGVDYALLSKLPSRVR